MGLTHSRKRTEKQRMGLRQSFQSQTDVSLSLTKHIISKHAKDTNFIYSPVSIHVVLGLIAAGSKGPTRDQLLRFLKSKSTEELNSLSSQMVTAVLADGCPLGGPRLSFANGVWVDRSLGLKPDFQIIAENAYKAASNHVDFRNKAGEVEEQVNTWANKKTNGLITQILPSGSVDASTSLIFTNAVYFKGAWAQKFNPRETKAHNFFLLNGNTVEAPFITSKNKQYVRAYDGFKVLGLPYVQGEDTRKFSMYIFLPDAKVGLPSLQEKVTSESGFIDHHLPYKQVKLGDFRIPKFRIAFGFEASKVLKGQGLALPFSGGGLTEMVDSQNLSVSSIFHKSFVEVNEEGTEAAAASTALVGRSFVMEEDELEFVANHPFLFVIREDVNGVVLFIGHLLNPIAG